ncbi:MAG: FAD-binding oxidoreductase [Elainellaceae cyanobacterium]
MVSISETYDWVVVGGGLAGAAASYELVRQGFSVLLLDSQAPQRATRYSYGGIPYWSGTTPLMQQLCREGHERHQILPAELDADTQLRELELLLTVATGQDPKQLQKQYTDCTTVPRVLSVAEACEREPLLNPEAIAGALAVRHGHVNPVLLIAAYRTAFSRLNGIGRTTTVTQIEPGNCPQVITPDGAIACANVLVCAGGLSRRLLKQSGLPIRQYFTHAELIETPPLALPLNTLVMPADMQRFNLESQATQSECETLWQQEAQRIAPPVLDPGAIQFLDRRICMGQISRTLGDPFATVDLAQSEASIRQAIGHILPALKDVPGQCHRCLVAFSHDGLPLIGPVPGSSNIHIFSGFGSPFAILPPLAQRFAAHVASEADTIITSLSPRRPSLAFN